MKKMFLAVLAMFSVNNSFAMTPAQCYPKVLSAYRYNNRIHKIGTNGLGLISLQYAVQSIQQSEELDNAQKSQALRMLTRPNSFFYEGAANYWGGSGLDIVIVDASSCRVVQSIMWYAE